MGQDINQIPTEPHLYTGEMVTLGVGFWGRLEGGRGFQSIQVGRQVFQSGSTGAKDAAKHEVSLGQEDRQKGGLQPDQSQVPRCCMRPGQERRHIPPASPMVVLLYHGHHPLWNTTEYQNTLVVGEGPPTDA